MVKKTDILFYYESRNNPNGDPGFDNQPRLMPDNTILVTDVRIKRTMRDYAKNVKQKELFADFGDDGLPVSARDRSKEIAKKADDNSKDLVKVMLKNTFDVPLFGALIPFPAKDPDPITNKQGSQKLTGPMQFAIGRSVNMVNVINPSITSRFIGDEAKGRHTTIGSFYAVEYALIKTSANINPINLGNYFADDTIRKNFENCCDMIPECLWDGTDNLVTRSKYPQNSLLYIEVNYDDKLHNDLPYLISENPELKGEIKELGKSPFIFDELTNALNERKGHILDIKIKCAKSIDSDVGDFISSLPGITVSKIP